MDRLDYTDRDFESLGKQLKNYIQQKFPEWTDFNEANFGNILKEAFQMVGDGLHYYQDKQVNNVFLMTTKLRKTAIAIAKRMSYIMDTNQPATVDQTFELQQSAQADVIIPAGEILKTEEKNNPFVFQLLETVTISAGSTSATGTIENSEPRTKEGEFNGDPDQEIELDYAPFIWGSEEVEIAGVPWSRAEDNNFLDAGPDSKIYVVEIDENDIAHLFFGDGQNGQAPDGQYTIDYKTGGGSEANDILANKITKLTRQFTDVNGNPVKLSTYNTESPSGGQNKETLEEAKINISNYKPSQNRTVGGGDYENNSMEVPGVARVLSLSARDDETIEEAHVYVYIVPDGGGSPSSQLLTDVEVYLTNEKEHSMSAILNVVSANYNTVNIEAEVWVGDSYTKSDVKSDIINTIEDYFSYLNEDGTVNYNINWGKEIAHSKLVSIIQNVDGVESLNLTTPSGNVTPGNKEIPALGTITLYDEDTGVEL